MEENVKYKLTEMRAVVEKAITGAKLTPTELMAAVHALAIIHLAENVAEMSMSMNVMRQWCEENWHVGGKR
jgi:hypothetical protein